MYLKLTECFKNYTILSVVRTLFKFVKKFEAALKEPCAPCLVEQGSSSSMDDVDSQPEETPLHRVHRVLKEAFPGKGRDLQVP